MNNQPMSPWVLFGAVAFSALALHTPVRAALVSPSLKKMLGGLPMAGIKDDLQGMVAALEKTPCGGGLKGCYLNRYPDLQNAFGRANYESALDHWFTNGDNEGRDARP